MYIGVPYSSVMYKLTVIETDISYNGDGNPAISPVTTENSRRWLGFLLFWFVSSGML